MSSRFHRPPRALEDDYIFTGRNLGEGMNGIVREAVRKDCGGGKFAVKPLKLFNATESKKRQVRARSAYILTSRPPSRRQVGRRL